MHGVMTFTEFSHRTGIPRSTLYDFWKRHNITTRSGVTYWLIGYTLTHFHKPITFSTY